MNEKDKAIVQAMASIQNRLRHVYNQGFEDGRKNERKTGKWKTAYLDHVAMGVRPKVLYCSACEQCIAYPTNYCPNCGAKMEVDE